MKKTALFTLLALALVAWSCEKQIEESLSLKSAADITLPVEGDVATVSFSTTVPWTAESSAAWLTLNPASGEAGDVSLKAAATKNDSNDNRKAVITIKAGSLSATVNVEQSQTDAITLATKEFTVSAEGGSVEIPVSANVDYTVEIPEAVDWISVVSTKGMTDSKVVLSVDGTQLYEFNDDWEIDPSTVVRSANVTIKYGSISEVVKIMQTTFEPYFEYEGDLAGLQWSFYDGVPVEFPQEGGEFTIDINTNIDWRCYMSVWDETIGDGVDIWDNGWARITFDDSHIYISMDANDSYFTREDYLYSVGIIDGEEDGNFGGLGWFIQAGVEIEGAACEFAWSKNLSELGIPAGYNRLAYTATGALLISDGEKVHAVSPADGTYWKAITYPGITPTSICSDDAGNVIVAPDMYADIDWGTGTLLSGTEYTIYYSANPNEMNNSITVENKDYGTVGGIRVRGDISKKAVITGTVGSASCWFGYDIENYAAVSNYYGTQNQGPGPGPNVFWSPETAASIALGTSLHEGVLFRGYDGAESLYYLADAYTPNWATPYQWQLLTDAGSGGNENQNNMALADFNGKRVLAYTQGFHFNYSSNATIYVLDVTDINDVKPLVTINPAQDIDVSAEFTNANSADVLLHPNDEYLELYVVHSGKDIVGRYNIIIK